MSQLRHSSGIKIVLHLAFVFWVCAVSAYPQTIASRSANQDDASTLKRGDNEFGLLGGTSLNTPTLIGLTEDARFTIVTLRYGRVLGTRGGVAVEYTMDAVPLAIFQIKHSAIYGAGISPIGFKFNFRRRKRAQPFLSTSGGLLYFARQVPVPGSAQFNFTFDFSGGVQLFMRSRKAITVGYKFQHISNGGTSAINPGLDANVVYAGISIFR